MTRQSEFQAQQQETESVQHQNLRNQKIEKEQAINDALVKFSNKRRHVVYSAMDDNQCHRFEDFMQSSFNDKKLKGLIQEILGGKNKTYEGGGKCKVYDEVVQALKAVSKIYVG